MPQLSATISQLLKSSKNCVWLLCDSSWWNVCVRNGTAWRRRFDDADSVRPFRRWLFWR